MWAVSIQQQPATAVTYKRSPVALGLHAALTKAKGKIFTDPGF